MKIYIITKGRYSDYHICAVATDEKQAEKLAKMYTDNYDDARVEEYDTEEYTDRLAAFDDTRLPFSVNFNDKGEVISVWRQGADGFEPRIQERTCQYSRLLNGERLRVYLYAPDEEAAVKIAAEKRAEYLAQKEAII